VTWRYEFRERENKWTKPPYQLDGKNARTNDSLTWASYEAVWKRYEQGSVDGIGIVLTTEMGIVGVDLDHCHNPQTNSFEPWAVKIIEQFNSYSELSPSGTGVRIFLKGKLPAGGHKKGNIEIYSTGRYLTVTGHILQGECS
jgi:primase-polymerase (primpol)-like protein